MKTEEPNEEVTDSTDERVKTADEPLPDEPDFKITVRKLEVPVRPRGVLAE